jgi:hypothetical protein
MSAAVSSELSASTFAVAMALPVRCFTEAAIASHLETVRDARVISPKVSGSMAHLWATTLPTPPAPMMRIFFISIWGKVLDQFDGRIESYKRRLGKYFKVAI